MSYKILEANGIENENIDGGAFNNFSAGGKSGIVKGVLNECKLTKANNIITVGTGLLLIKGVRVKMPAPQDFTLSGTPAVPINYHLIAKVTINGARLVTFDMFTRVEEPLVKDDIYKTETGTYELEIAKFIHDANGNVSNLTMTAELIQGGGGSNEVDSELSTESENPVQNKVVTEALDNKLNKPTDTGSSIRICCVTSKGTQTWYYLETTNSARQSWVSTYLPPSNGSVEPNGNGVLLMREPTLPYQLANKKYVDNAINPLTAKTNEMQTDINQLYLYLNATITGTEELTQEYSERITANGLSGLIDGALTRVTKIEGNTVVVDEKLKNSYFKGVISTNSDGTKTDESFMLDNAVELGLGVTIDIQNKKIIDNSQTVVLTGEEDWLIGSIYLSKYNSLFCYNILPTSQNRANGVATEGRVAKFTNDLQEYGYGVWWCGVNNDTLYILGAEQYFNLTQFADPSSPTAEEKKTLKAEWKAYLAQQYANGNPVTIRYVSKTGTETDIAIPTDKYQAWVGGSETQVQGDINNSEYGANNTITQTYAVVKGGAE